MSNEARHPSWALMGYGANATALTHLAERARRALVVHETAAGACSPATAQPARRPTGNPSARTAAHRQPLSPHGGPPATAQPARRPTGNLPCPASRPDPPTGSSRVYRQVIQVVKRTSITGPTASSTHAI